MPSATAVGTLSRAFLIISSSVVANGFVLPLQPRTSSKTSQDWQCSLTTTSTPSETDDAALQWELFNKHHAKGSWKGIWTTYNFIGDVIDETVASVDLIPGPDQIQHTHTIVVGAKRSDCATCFDSMEKKTLPVAEYSPVDLKKSRFAACSMVNGPSLLRSGAMATELVLNHGDGRVRVIFQHAPVWEQGVEPGSCPPQGLKLFRALISREALRDAPPTADTEAANPPKEGNPIFNRPVPPFNWFKKWGGNISTAWTWGKQKGNQGWAVEEMDDGDAWQGVTPVDSWNLRLGSIHVQCPSVITDASTGICRLAWLPDDETLLRVEAGVMVLQPLIEDDVMTGFELPSLTSLRCDMMKKTGELDREKEFIPSRDLNKDDDTNNKVQEPQIDTKNSSEASRIKKTQSSNPQPESDSSSNPIRDSLSL
ncbi:unnamed protein product [Cylindrotheca closterium]|uniref:DUF3598 domain-containing protein n=1 Tax=Cylindrotheca closterium TaxID=2856 RepID=A0AAD2CNG8_9STRA|nr:unnamed protein product [Cylindrotheca closterium]